MNIHEGMAKAAAPGFPSKRVPETADFRSRSLIFDRPGLFARLMSDEQLVHRVLETYLIEIPNRLEALDRAVNNGNFPKAGRTAHLIKGASANVNAQALQDKAQQMEDLVVEENGVQMIRLVGEIKEQFELFKRAVELGDLLENM